MPLPQEAPANALMQISAWTVQVLNQFVNRLHHSWCEIRVVFAQFARREHMQKGTFVPQNAILGKIVGMDTIA